MPERAWGFDSPLPHTRIEIADLDSDLDTFRHSYRDRRGEARSRYLSLSFSCSRSAAKGGRRLRGPTAVLATITDEAALVLESLQGATLARRGVHAGLPLASLGSATRPPRPARHRLSSRGQPRSWA